MERDAGGDLGEVLKVERVGRHDNFFELGGHSLLIVQVMEQLRNAKLAADVRSVYDSATLADLATMLDPDPSENTEEPTNLIPIGCQRITPEMLSLVKLDETHIEQIVRTVPGGAANIQDIYPLAPLQEGMLFQHLFNERSGDAYVLATLLSVSSKRRLTQLIEGLQNVIDRHDVLRTAVLWEQLPQPVQVVCRQATLPVEVVALDAQRDTFAQVHEWIRPDRQRMSLKSSPMMRLQVAADPHRTQWYALLQLHHIVDDATSLKIVIGETVAYLEGYARSLAAPVPYRHHIVQALMHARTHDATEFFRTKLGDISEPTAPFGLLDVNGDGSEIAESRVELESTLSRGLRACARRIGVSAATLFHAAWALVVSHTSGREDVVFGTVLLGRLQGSAGAKRILGMFINTLPLRIPLRDLTSRELVSRVHQELVDLFDHEQASLSDAQRCSAVRPADTAVFHASELSSQRAQFGDGMVWCCGNQGTGRLRSHELSNNTLD